MRILVQLLCVLALSSCASPPPTSARSTDQEAYEHNLARYYNDWRDKVEHLANLHYPPEAKGKIHGSVIATIEIGPDGTVDSIKIDRSSGHQVLDDAVRKIVMLGSPYAPFSTEMRRDVDVLEICRIFTFTRGEGTMFIRPREAIPQKRAKQ